MSSGVIVLGSIFVAPGAVFAVRYGVHAARSRVRQTGFRGPLIHFWIRAENRIVDRTGTAAAATARAFVERWFQPVLASCRRARRYEGIAHRQR